DKFHPAHQDRRPTRTYSRAPPARILHATSSPLRHNEDAETAARSPPALRCPAPTSSTLRRDHRARGRRYKIKTARPDPLHHRVPRKPFLARPSRTRSGVFAFLISRRERSAQNNKPFQTRRQSPRCRAGPIASNKL